MPRWYLLLAKVRPCCWHKLTLQQQLVPYPRRYLQVGGVTLEETRIKERLDSTAIGAPFAKQLAGECSEQKSEGVCYGYNKWYISTRQRPKEENRTTHVNQEGNHILPSREEEYVFRKELGNKVGAFGQGINTFAAHFNQGVGTTPQQSHHNQPERLHLMECVCWSGCCYWEE